MDKHTTLMEKKKYLDETGATCHGLEVANIRLDGSDSDALTARIGVLRWALWERVSDTKNKQSQQR